MENQPEGINLDIDDDGAVQIVENEDLKKAECFGGAMCRYLQKQTHEIPLMDGTTVLCNKMWCMKSERSVVDIFYDEMARCPLDLWVKAAMPKYYAPVASPSQPPKEI